MEKQITKEALKQFKPVKKLRKRFLVSEGDLFELYASINLILDEEKKSQHLEKFNELLANAQPVKIVRA